MKYSNKVETQLGRVCICGEQGESNKQRGKNTCNGPNYIVAQNGIEYTMKWMTLLLKSKWIIEAI